MAEFNDRDVEFHSLPLSESVELPDISKLILVYKKGHSHDFGALCYLHRSSQRRRRNSGRRVDFDSFDKDRSSEIQALVKLASESFSFSGLRPYTLFSHHKSFIHFMDWCDSNQHSKVFSNHTNARAAFREYVDYLRRLVSQNQLNNNSAVHYQEHVLAILQDFLNVENLSQGISLLMQSNHHVEATTIPDNASQEKVLAWCKCILYGFSELCIDQKPFPYPLDVPSYLNWPNDKLWVFPVKRWCESPGQKPDKSYVAYDYQAGKIRTAEEIDQLYGRPVFPSQTVNKIVEAQRLITASNQDFLSFSRIERGMLAVKAFLMMFIASTGKNPLSARV